MAADVDPSRLIDAVIGELDDWRGQQLAEIRRLIHDALPEVEEEWKWMGSPVWEQDGIIAVGNAHKKKVKLTFPQGAHLDDPQEVFNAGLGGKAWRAIDLFEGDSLNKRSFKALVKRAARYNASQKDAK
jgi:hypothetical protein